MDVISEVSRLRKIFTEGYALITGGIMEVAE